MLRRPERGVFIFFLHNGRDFSLPLQSLQKKKNDKMAYIDLTILGCGSATPTMRHNPASQILRLASGRLMMIDCGEGTQLQMRRFGFSYAKLTDIFISHLHGDHFLGLPGLLSTMSLHNVGGTVTIHVFKEGAELLKSILAVFCRETTFEVRYNIIDPKALPAVIYEDKAMTVEAFRLYHRVECCGFIFREKPRFPHLDGEMLKFHGVPEWQRRAIKENGADFVKPDGTVVPNSVLTRPADPSRSYAYCSDTSFNHAVARAVKGVDVLYHESTYGEVDAQKAAPRGHSTAAEAARIAAEADAGRLILGHFSKVVADSSVLVAEAAAIFPDVVAANEGMNIVIS